MMETDTDLQLLLLDELYRRITKKLHWSLFRMPGIQTTDRLVRIENVVQFFFAQLVSDLRTDITQGRTPWIPPTPSEPPEIQKK